jgi:hypothetical protein
MAIEKSQKIAKIYCCEMCDYTTSNLYDFNKHNNTQKHIINDKSIFSIEKSQKSQHECSCGKSYKDNSGLWRHKKKCNIQKQSTNNDEIDKIVDSNVDSIDKNQLILMLIKQNADLIKDTSEFKSMMMEVIKNGTHNTIHTNSHNKSFNLNVFLNETCKDAMNIMEFVDSIKIQLCDLENFEKLGYVQGMSKIIVNNLNLLDETKRPVHCTDSKREVMYVKDENKWEKENENKTKMRKVIKHVTHKNTKLFKEYKAKYPGCEKSDSKYSNTYDKLIVEAFGGKGDNDIEKEDKIIRNIAKNVLIDKTNGYE